MYIDSHCHLDFPDFADDRAAVIGAARAAGVVRMMTISTRLLELPNLLRIADDYPEVFATVGVHPHHADEHPGVTAESLIALSQSHPKIVGFGESGLDFHYQHSSPERQYVSFRAHCGAARATGLPLVVHSREAEAETLAVLREQLAIGSFPFLIHCFSGSQDFAEQSLALGGFLSFSGIVSFKNATAIHAAARLVPSDRYLIETDSPYLAPVPRRGQRNQPGFVIHTAEAIARLRNCPAVQVAAESTSTYFSLFDRVPRP